MASFIQISHQFQIQYDSQIIYHSFDDSKLMNYQDLVSYTKERFNIKPNQNECLTFLYLDKDKDNNADKIEISNDVDFQEILRVHFGKTKTPLPIEITVTSKKSNNSSINNLSSFQGNLNDSVLVESKYTNVPVSQLGKLASKNILDSNSMDFSISNSNNGLSNQNEERKSNEDSLSSSSSSGNQTKYFTNTKKWLMKNKEEVKMNYGADNIYELCDFCNFSIKKVKYSCVICDAYQLCSKCYENNPHFHPMLAINVLNNSSIIKNHQDYLFYLNTNKILEKFIERQKNPSKNVNYTIYEAIVNKNNGGRKLRLKIFPFAQKEKFAIPKNNIYTYQIVVENKSKKSIDNTLYFVFKNTNNMVIKCENILEIKGTEVKIVDAFFISGNKTECCELEIFLMSKDNIVECNSIKANVYIVDSNRVDEKNANLFFEKYEYLNKLSKPDKIKLYKNINNGAIDIKLDELNLIAQKKKNNIIEILNTCSEQIEKRAEEEGDN